MRARLHRFEAARVASVQPAYPFRARPFSSRVAPLSVRLLALSFVVLAPACDRSPPPSVQTAHDPDPTASGVPASTAITTLDASAATTDASPVETSYLPPSLEVDLPTSMREAVASAAATLKRKTVVHTDIDSFVLIDADRGPNYPKAVSIARQAVAGFYNARFDKHPTRAVTVFVYSYATEYERFCEAQSGGVCPSRFGEFDRIKRTIVFHATTGSETLNHEMVHPLIRDDFARAPAWLDEGIASLMEAPVSCAPGHLTGVRNWRYPELIAALDSPRDRPTTRIDALFAMDNYAFLTLDPAHVDAGSTDPRLESLHYSLSRLFAQWLDRAGKLWKFYHFWRDGIATDRTGERAFAAVMGRTPAEANADWESYVRSLDRPGADPPCPPR
jgi:hypothetical protein